MEERLIQISLPSDLKDYTLTREIGKGGFSKVFYATCSRFPFPLAIKVSWMADAVTRKGYMAEIKALLDLNHPHIIRVYDHFQIQEYDCIVLEYCRNGSLRSCMNHSGLLVENFAIYAFQIISALNCCHQHGIAHHDIKPENVLLNELKRCKLADFGLSQGGIESEIFAGTLHYAAPEILLHRKYDHFKADIWALGVLFFFMLTGTSPWKGRHPQELILSAHYSVPSIVPEKYSSLIKQMIVLDPNERISMEQLADISSTWKVKITVSQDDYNADLLSPRARLLRKKTIAFNKTDFSQSSEKIPKVLRLYNSGGQGRNRPAMFKPRLKSSITHVQTFPRYI